MHRFTFAALLPLLCLTGCDNVGRAFDPSVDPGGGEPATGESTIQVVPYGGDTREGRPKIKSIAPEDGGWPTTVPIVIEFSESVNEASIAPTTPTGSDGRIALRVQGTTQVLPCVYDFLGGGKLLVMRPVTELSNEQLPTYEVVLFPDARDTDGVRFLVSGDEEVLAEFQVNQAASFEDGRILATCPRDNKTDAARESTYIVVFDRPANVNSVNGATNFVLSQGGAAVAGNVDVPLTLVGQDDGRVLRFIPDAPLAASQGFEFTVDSTITFGSAGALDFNGASPFAVFDTIGPQAPTEVHVGNPTPGFDDKINAQNLAGLLLHVTTPADAQVGDTVVVRIYGFDIETSTTGDLAYVEATAEVSVAGAQTIVVDFGTQLGTVASPRFEDGEVVFCAQLRRGSQQSGYMQSDTDAELVFDVTMPSLAQVGTGLVGNDIVTDLEHLVFFGTASERLGEASLTDGVNPTVPLFAADDSGFFALEPITLGRLLAPRGYSLTFSDRAGNMVAAPITGNIVQRGVVTGTLAGTLTVEAYDAATLLPIAAASVLVDPGMPVVPAVGQLAGTTDANGTASFSSLTTSQHSVTVIADGYHLVTFLDTTAARVSLPLRPLATAAAEASFTGNVAFQPTVGTTALVGNSALADRDQLGIATSSGDPTTIPVTAIEANRPQVVTAFGGTFEPTAVPTYSYHGYQMLGPTLMEQSPPTPPAAAGSTAEANLLLLPSAGTTASLSAYTKDFALAAGLDTANLLGGGPIARMTAGLTGFGRQVLAGAGLVTANGGGSYTMQQTYGLPLSAGLAAFGPTLWAVAEARDTGGRLSRHRALLLFGLVADVTNVPSIPVITPPAGPAMGAPQVTFDDVMDPAPIPGGLALAEIIAQDGAGRRWTMFRIDPDGIGGTESVQYPDVSASAAVGLALGDWDVTIEARLQLSLTSSTVANFVLAERLRQEANYSRSASQTFSVQ